MEEKNAPARQMGRIELICGPMFAGKTTRLIARLMEHCAAGEPVLAVKPAADNRYGAKEIVTHDGGRMDAVAIENVSDFEDRAADASVIGIDELHFFDPNIADVCSALKHCGKTIVAAGVDLDHRTEAFAAVAAVERIADTVTRVTATCAQCGGVASLTRRLIESQDAIVVGGAGDYEPRCPSCFHLPQKGC